MADFASDFERSRHEFVQLVIPVIKPLISSSGHAVIIPHEGIPCRSCNQLDHHCGIDYLHVDFGRGVRGIAARVQWRSEWDSRWPWDTFTIRVGRDSGSMTELAKLQCALDDPGWMRPALHVHAYTSDGALDSVAVVRTDDLIPFLADRINETDRLRRTSNAVFAWASWSELEAAGIRVKSWSASDQEAA